MNTLDREASTAAIPQLEQRITSLETSLLDRVYPVGSYFYHSSATYDPAAMGGEWEKETNSSPYRWKRVR